MTLPTRPGPGLPSGFTLLEVVIAFAIAALALTALTRGAASGLQSAVAASQYEQAISRARSHLAVLDTGLQPGDSEGDDGGGFRWRLRVVPVASIEPRPSGAGKPPPLKPTLFRATVTIAWSGDGRTRSVQLTTERLGVTPLGS